MRRMYSEAQLIALIQKYAPSGTKLYKHSIELASTSLGLHAYFDIINSKSNSYGRGNPDDLINYLLSLAQGNTFVTTGLLGSNTVCRLIKIEDENYDIMLTTINNGSKENIFIKFTSHTWIAYDFTTELK